MKPEPTHEIVGLLLDRGAEMDVFRAAALGLAGRLRALLDADPSLGWGRRTMVEWLTARGGT